MMLQKSCEWLNCVFDLNSGTYDVTKKLWMIKLYLNISDVDHANVT